MAESNMRPPYPYLRCPHCGAVFSDHGIHVCANLVARRGLDEIAQGRCETTLTERFDIGGCHCGTYEGNLGPCRTFEPGANGRCVYCDHASLCHSKVANA